MKKNKDCNCPEDIEDVQMNISESSDSQPNLAIENIESSAESDQPLEAPPYEDGDAEQDSGAFGAGAWHNNKKVTSLWSKDETRNSWAAVSGLGWKKLNSSNNSSCVALTILSAHAKQYNRNVKLKIDNNQIKEMYVW